MSSYDELLKELAVQEETLQFTEFTNETALNIGLKLIENAKKEGKSITIDITRGLQQMFHYSFKGTSADNDQWVAGKNKVVYRFNRSSLYINTLLNSKGNTIEEKYHISPLEYRPYGGAFPIIIKNVGVVGTITVSGLAQEEDHQMVVDAIREYLGL